MKYLLDTCVLIWAIQGDVEKLGDYSKTIINPEVPVWVSIVSYWEIVIKQSLGKIRISDNFINLVEQSGFTWLSLELHHVQKLRDLPAIHRDPFDRLLVAQALSDGFEMMTADSHVQQYF